MKTPQDQFQTTRSIDTLAAGILPLDQVAMAAARDRQDRLTKPRPRMRHKVVAVLAGDHGVAAEGVSAFPPLRGHRPPVAGRRAGAALSRTGFAARTIHLHGIGEGKASAALLAEVDALRRCPDAKHLSDGPAAADGWPAPCGARQGRFEGDAGQADLHLGRAGAQVVDGDDHAQALRASPRPDAADSPALRRGGGAAHRRLPAAPAANWTMR